MFARLVWGTLFLVQMCIYFTRGGDKSYLDNALIDGAHFMKGLPLTTCVEHAVHEGDQKTNILFIIVWSCLVPLSFFLSLPHVCVRLWNAVHVLWDEDNREITVSQNCKLIALQCFGHSVRQKASKQICNYQVFFCDCGPLIMLAPKLCKWWTGVCHLYEEAVWSKLPLLTHRSLSFKVKTAVNSFFWITLTHPIN